VIDTGLQRSARRYGRTSPRDGIGDGSIHFRDNADAEISAESRSLYSGVSRMRRSELSSSSGSRRRSSRCRFFHEHRERRLSVLDEIDDFEVIIRTRFAKDPPVLIVLKFEGAKRTGVRR
jgi:hypothetical protein